MKGKFFKLNECGYEIVSEAQMNPDEHNASFEVVVKSLDTNAVSVLSVCDIKYIEDSPEALKLDY